MALDELMRTHKGPLSANEVNQLVRTIAELKSRVQNLEHSLTVMPQQAVPILGRIVGRVNPAPDDHRVPPVYYFELLGDGANGTPSRNWQGAIRGTTAQLPAYERSGNRNVPIDGSAIVQLVASEAQGAYFFTWSDARATGRITTNVGGGKYLVQPQYRSGFFPDGEWVDSPGVAEITVYESSYSDAVDVGSTISYYRGPSGGAPRIITEHSRYGDGTYWAKQNVSLVGAIGGTFRLIAYPNFDFSTVASTAGIAWDGDAAAVQAALNGLPAYIPGAAAIVVSGGNGSLDHPFVVEYPSDNNARPLLMGDESALVGQHELLFDKCCSPIPIVVDTVYWNLGSTNSTFTYANGSLSNVTFTNSAGINVTFPSNGTKILIARCPSCGSVPGLWRVSSPGNLTKMAEFTVGRTVGQEIAVNRSLDYGNGTPNFNGSIWAYRYVNSEFVYCQTARCIDADLTGSSYRRRGNSLTMETGGVSPSNTSSGRITGQNITWGTLQDDAATGRASFKGAFHFRWNIDSYSSANTAQPLWNWNTTSGADNANAALGPNFIPLVGNGTFSLGTTYPSLSIPGGTPCFLTNAGAANITINYNSLPTQNLTLAPGEGAVFIKNDGANSAKPNNWFLAGVGFKKNFQELALEAFGNVTNGQAIYQRNGNWTVTENSGLTANGSLPNGAIFWFDEAQQKLVSLDSVPSTIGTLLVWDGSKWAITDTPGSGSNAPLLYDAAAPNGLKWGSSLASGNFTWLDGDGVTTRFIEFEKGMAKDYG